MRKSLSSAALIVSMSVLALSAAQSLAAQGAASPAPAPGAQPLEVLRLTPNIYWDKIHGFGAFIVGDKGVIVIDTGDTPAAGKQVLEAVANVTPKPVTTVILTHGDADHVNGLVSFPAGIQIIAQEECSKYLKASAASGKTGHMVAKVPADHMPNHLVANREDITIDGEKMQLLHWAPGHTAGDMAIYLPVEKIVLVGDMLVLDQHNLPLVHGGEKGGTSGGWIASVKGLLSLDASLYLVGHQGAVIRDVLEKQLHNAIAEREQVKQLYDKGESLAQIQAAVGDPMPQWLVGLDEEHTFPAYSEIVYNELKNGTYRDY